MNTIQLKLLIIVSSLVSVIFMMPWQFVVSAEREYVVPMVKAKWISGGKKNFECSLSQTIPFYGEGKFIHKSGREVVFHLLSNELITSDVNVIIQSEPPSWRHKKVFEIGQFIFKQGSDPLVVQYPYASRMLQEVENGMSPIVVYRDLADGRDLISVLLSPLTGGI